MKHKTILPFLKKQILLLLNYNFLYVSKLIKTFLLFGFFNVKNKSFFVF